MLVDVQRQILQTKASLGKGVEFTKDAQLPMGEGIAGWVVKNGKPLLLNGEVAPINFPGTIKKVRNINSAMCLPLKIGKKCIGVLNVNLMEREKTFSENDLKLTMVFANNAAVAIHNAILMGEKHQRIRFQTILEQLHSPQVAKELVNRIEDWNQPNRMREKIEMTLLFADIRGFSQMMNRVELEAIIDFLDEYYSTMTRIVFESRGSINKFIGDEVMAFFGAPIPLENATENGVGAALDMVASFTGLKEKFSGISPHFRNLGIGIGINTGTVFVGNVGSKKRYDYTVIGNAVNVARRLCSHAAQNEVLASTKTVARLKGNYICQFIEKKSFKGIPYDIDVYRLLDNQIFGHG
jgi:adenylate cyclase